MGTYSRYRLGIVRDEYLSVREKQKIIQQLFDDCDIDPHKEMARAISLDGQTEQEAKWYNADEHLIAFSQKYPDLRFILGIADWDDEYGQDEYFTLFHQGQAIRDQRRFMGEPLTFGDLELNEWSVFRSQEAILFQDQTDFLEKIIQQQHDDQTIIIIPFKKCEDMDEIEIVLNDYSIFSDTKAIFKEVETLFPDLKGIRTALKVNFPSEQYPLFLEAAERYIFEMR